MKVTAVSCKLKLSACDVATEEDKVDLAIFIPQTQADIDDLYNELTAVIAQIKDYQFKQLLESFFADEEIVRKF